MAELNQSTGKSGGRNLKRMPVRVDLTAMVDLAFLLITFFMLTTSLQKPRKMEVNMPADAPPQPYAENTTMSICIGAKNKLVYYLGMPEKPLTQPKLISDGKDIRTAIVDMTNQVFKKTGKAMALIIKPAEHSVYENLVNVLDEANLNKVTSYSIGKITASDIAFLKEKGVY
ncbi:biopolymer transporter ExbD [Mucilaginibacter sp. BJC16-A38]|uniref:ExbD/TolR family protein n=1 Tax=Mucilaginibacter phenanthrenivorans TaxID=1234842 RepID=UPI0021572554|nr:biopolymer transporter ExbD [Mucilaginibacter phenanthrenivorans]MCR8558227.1 biopolymer transporter ExbD [Mucilaginibacter phenanthrenivorans]